MTWTFKKTHLDFSNGHVVVTVRYVSDTGDSFDESYSTQNVTGIWPDDAIAQRLTGLNAVDTAKIELGSTLKTAAVPKLVDPTPRDDYFSNLGRLRQFQDLITLGVIDTSDKTYAELLANARAGFDPAFYAG